MRWQQQASRRSRPGSCARCSNSRSISVARRNPDELSSSSRSGRAISRHERLVEFTLCGRPLVPAVHVSVLARVEDDMEAGRRDDDRDDDVLQWAHVHG
jgi:hypothetical protein